MEKFSAYLSIKTTVIKIEIGRFGINVFKYSLIPLHATVIST